jgi:hypothetical protein
LGQLLLQELIETFNVLPGRNRVRQAHNLGGQQQLPLRQGRIIVDNRPQHKKAVRSGMGKKSLVSAASPEGKTEKGRRIGFHSAKQQPSQRQEG